MMAFEWCQHCKKHLVPKGVMACRTCSSDLLAWKAPDDREDITKGDWLLILSVIAAALISVFVIALAWCLQ
jgi:hypothetical protein